MNRRVEFVDMDFRTGQCRGCGNTFVHRFNCPIYILRSTSNDGTDPDKPPIAYAGGLTS